MSRVNTDVGAEAEAVLNRLTGVSPSRPCDRAKVESALSEHLRALDLDPRPVRWIEAGDADQSARDGFLAFWAGRYKKGKPEAPGMTHTASSAALWGGGLRTAGVVGPALKEEKEAGRSLKHAAHRAGPGAGEPLSSGRGDRMNIEVVEAASAANRLMDAARAALAEKGIHQQFGFVPGQMEAKRQQGLGELKREVEVGSAAAQALEAANWLARAHVLEAAGKPVEAHERVAQVYLPLVDAVEAGLWLFWVMEDEVIAVAAPADG